MQLLIAIPVLVLVWVRVGVGVGIKFIKLYDTYFSHRSYDDGAVSVGKDFNDRVLVRIQNSLESFK